MSAHDSYSRAFKFEYTMKTFIKKIPVYVMYWTVSSMLLINSYGNFLRQVTELVLGNNGQDPLVFWHFVRDFLTKHERDRYEQLKQIYTDMGRGRAWLRSALNEKSLERYMLCLTGLFYILLPH